MLYIFGSSMVYVFGCCAKSAITRKRTIPQNADINGMSSFIAKARREAKMCYPVIHTPIRLRWRRLAETTFHIRSFRARINFEVR